jgi:uncharacterized protein
MTAMTDLTLLVEYLGDSGATAVVGLLLGLVFGCFAQRSRFCTRSAFLDIGQAKISPALLVWLAALGTGTLLAALATLDGVIALEAIGLRANPASLSGALVGGALFGAGMVLARGCASRHLVLAGSGNLRAWVTFGLFAIVAAAAIAGPLASLRQSIGAVWTIGAEYNDVAALVGGGAQQVAVVSVLILGTVLFAARLRGVSFIMIVLGGILGATLVGGWVVTSGLAGLTFEPTKVETIAFTGPAAAVLGFVMAPLSSSLSFEIGMVAGVFAGALVAAVVFGEYRVEWFRTPLESVRYLAGAVLMGFGGVLAVGCTVGALGNAVVLVTSSWVALAAMAGGAAVAYRLVDAPRGAGGHRPHAWRLGRRWRFRRAGYAAD